MTEFIVVTCRLCRGWYNMDMEEGLSDNHFNMRTGEPCNPEDGEWHATSVPTRSHWAVAH